ncbi:MAG: cation:proton antiporter [Acidimicrobiia bacterium]|nr:cation:proton antiporter [Acidimicrobiia bacterium]
MSPAEVLRDVLVVLVAAKIAAELAERIGIPAVVGEIVAGVLIGPSLLGLVSTTSALEVLAELGVILLLLQVGMEMDIKELAAVGRASVSVAVLGVILPLVLGYAAGLALGYDSNTALFLGAALAATSVGITARVFADLGVLSSVEARTVMGAAVADDVLGLVLLTIVVRMVSDGSVSAATVISTILLAVGFLVVTTVLGGRLGIVLFRGIQRYSRSAGTLVALALAFALAFAELANLAKLAPIVGAFVAGLALSRSESRERIARELTPVGHLFVPVFFLQIGIAAEVERFVDPKVLGIAGVLVVVALVTKIASCLAVFGSPGDKLTIGFGMVPRGEVGLIFATIGLSEGVLGRDLYAALVLVVLITTLVAPPMLRFRLRAVRDRLQPEPVDPMPASGWLWVDDGVVDLAAMPPPELQTVLALDAALLVSGGARPGPKLLDWLGRGGPTPWDGEATQRLVDVLMRGNDRGWRFLDTSGVLVRALPEVADAVERWHRDPELSDPTQVVRFDAVDTLQRIIREDRTAAAVAERLENRELLVLAALVSDLTGEHPPGALVAALADRLDLETHAHGALLALTADQGLLRGVASRANGLGETSVLSLGSHLGDPERVRGLYLLDLAEGPLEPAARDRLDTLLGRVLSAVEGIGERDEPNEFARRRDAAIRLAGTDEGVADRVLHAPRSYLLAELPERVVATARLMEPRPERRDVRVAVGTRPSGGVVIDVATKDQRGILAAVTAAFAERELDVVRAQVATWGDGSALESFDVEPRPGCALPSPDELANDISARLGGRMEAAPLADSEIAFDDAGSPWYTICEVRHVDRPGLLSTIAAALSLAGVSVHAAQFDTVDGHAVDRFSLTDQAGAKLRREQKDAIRSAVTGGARGRGRLGRLVRG